MTNSTKKPFNIMDLKPQSKDKREEPGGNAPQKKTTKARYITFDGHTKIVSSEGKTSTLEKLHAKMEIGGKQTIHCPSPDHVDESPSAFIDKKQSGDLFIFCASCGQKGFYRSPSTKNGREKSDKKPVTLPISVKPVIDLNDGNNGKKSPTQMMTEIGCKLELFHNSVNEAYAVIERAASKCVVQINSNCFSEYLAYTVYQLNGTTVNASSVKDAAGTLTSIAKFEKKKMEVHIRVDNQVDTVIIDRCTDENPYIEIDKNGYKLKTSVGTRFLRKTGMEGLPELAERGDITLLRKYINLSQGDLSLLYGWLFCTVAGVKPFPILILQGEQGTGKSTVSKLLRLLVDPSSAPLRSPPKNAEELFISAINCYLVALDNLSGVKPDLADGLCRICTGAAFNKRKLYSDSDQILLQTQNPIIVNGISDIATRPDLAERSIILELPVIQPSERRSEKEYWMEFEEDLPFIFTGILDGIVSGLKHQDSVEIDEKPRMASVVEWAAACERDLGMEGNFSKAFKANQEESKEDAIEASPIGVGIRALMSDRASYTGAPTALCKELQRRMGDAYGSSSLSPKSLHGEIKRLKPSFRVVGIEINQKKSGSRQYHIRNSAVKGGEGGISFGDNKAPNVFKNRDEPNGL